MNSNDTTSVRDRILAKIERREVRMHPRAYFAVRVAAVVALAVVALLLTVFIGNLLFFTLRLNGHGELLSLGSKGIGLFVSIFPWWMLALDIVVCAALVWLVRHFQFGYRRPILSAFFALVVIALVAGFALDRGTGLNDLLLRDADDGHLPPPLDSLYQGARRTPPEGKAYRGTIGSVSTTSLMLTDPDHDNEVNVILPTDGPAAGRVFRIGETVFVVGERQGDTIQARDIQEIDPTALPPRHHPGGGDAH